MTPDLISDLLLRLCRDRGGGAVLGFAAAGVSARLAPGSAAARPRDLAPAAPAGAASAATPQIDFEALRRYAGLGPAELSMTNVLLVLILGVTLVGHEALLEAFEAVGPVCFVALALAAALLLAAAPVVLWNVWREGRMQQDAAAAAHTAAAAARAAAEAAADVEASLARRSALANRLRQRIAKLETYVRGRLAGRLSGKEVDQFEKASQSYEDRLHAAFAARRWDEAMGILEERFTTLKATMAQIRVRRASSSLSAA